ncbi:MAG: ABC transporter permease [Acidobacteriota bacterium]|nr:ABC transporter permease [Acidobacteriota bacterium]
MLRDLRYGLRTLIRQPTFSLVAIATLSLGIGASTAIFSLVKAVVLNQLPYSEPESLVVLWEQNPQGERGQVSTPTFLDWQRQSSKIDTFAAYRHVRYTFTGSDEPLDIPSLRVTPELFSVLGTDASRGRSFVAEEAITGQDRVAVLSQGFWRRHYDGDPAIVGRQIELDARAYTVVGVMPERFDFPPGSNIGLWTALSFDPNDAHGRSRRSRGLNVVGRVAGGASLEQARAEMRSITQALATEHPDTMKDWGVVVQPAHDELVENVRPALMLLMGAVGFLLLIACVNVANLLLARLSSRRREMALRGALGAGRLPLARQVLAESFVLALPGAAGGLLLTLAAIRIARSLPIGILPRLEQVSVDGGVLVFTLGVSVAVSLVFGFLPALQASQPQLRSSLAETAGSGGRPAAQRSLSALIVVEVALALVLLSAAGIATRSFSRLMAVDPGFVPNHLLAAQIYLPQPRYPERKDRIRFFDDALARVRALPGVVSAGAVSALPMHPVGIEFALPFSIEGKEITTEEPRVDLRAATPGYFETLRIALRSGRLLDERDREDAPHTMLINETLARRYFSDEDPLGGLIITPHGRGEIVGVVADVRHHGLDNEPRPEIYLPFEQQVFPGMAIVARTSQDPAALATTLRSEIWGVDSDQPIHDLSTMDQAISRWVFLPRLSSRLLGAFAAAALLLAMVGIFGVISYSVTQRRPELGMRKALGAASSDLVLMVMRRSMTLVAVGMGLGLLGSIAATRLLSRLLYGVGPFEPAVVAGVSVLLLAVAALASFLPARRAAKVDPMRALRVE